MKKFKLGFIFSLIVCLIMGMVVQPVVAAGTTAAQLLTADDVEVFLNMIMQEQMETHNIPNATVAVVANGEVLLANGYGYANMEEQIRTDAESLFRIGSTSKLFTWTAVMQLVEQGKLDLDTDVNEYLDFQLSDRVLHGGGNKEHAPITMKHLMTHSAGFEDYSSHIFKLSEDKQPSLYDYVRDYEPARAFPAGEVVAYSNYSTALAGYIVEQVSGMTFSEYVEQNIYEPLGMEYSTFRQPLPESLSPHMVQAYRYVNGQFREGAFEYLPEPAGSMSSSATDMAKFMLAHLQHGEYNGVKILEEETARQMHSQLFTYHPKLDGFAHGFIEGTFNDRHSIFHPGGTMLFDTGMYLLPEENVGFFISFSGGNHFVFLDVFQAFMDRYFPSTGANAAASEGVSSGSDKSNASDESADATESASSDKSDASDQSAVPVGVNTLKPPAGALERATEYVGEYHSNRKSLTTSDKMLSVVMGTIQIDVDDEGYLLVTHVGETHRFVETEEGVYQSLREGRSPDPGGDFRTIVFGTDPIGRTMLMTDGPLTYSKVPWYETSAFTFSALILSLVFIIGSLLYWGIKGIVQFIRGKVVRRNNPIHPMALSSDGIQVHDEKSVLAEVAGRRPHNNNRLSKLAKWTAIGYGFLTFIFLIDFMSGGMPDPVYILPAAAYGETSALAPLFNLIPLVMVIVGAMLVVMTVVAWWKSLWRVLGRIHYTLITGAAMMLAWVFIFWNIM